MKYHELKTDPAVFAAVIAGAKTHEIRFDDRGFVVGDVLVLRETKFTGYEMRTGQPLEYTGRTALRSISHIQAGYGLAENWVILSFSADTPAAGRRKDDARPTTELQWDDHPNRWTLLLTGQNHGLVGEYGSTWPNQPAEFERVNVSVEIGEPTKTVDQLEAELQAARAEAGKLTDAQISAGAAVLCDCPEPKRIGRNAAIDVFDAMTAVTTTITGRSALQAENDELRQDLSDARRGWESAVEEVRYQDEDAQDAARYRWLRDTEDRKIVEEAIYYSRGKRLDAAIDAAIAGTVLAPVQRVEDAMMTLDADRARRLEERGPDRRQQQVAVAFDRRSGSDRRGPA